MQTHLWMKSACGLAALTLAGSALAQAFPAHPVKILTTGAGGVADVTGRFVAPEMAKSLGQPVIIDTRPAGVGVGLAVAKAPRDGYTLMMGPVTGTWIGPLFQDEATYEIKDLMPVSLAARGPLVLVINAAVPAKSVKELIQLAKSEPGKLNYSSGSTGAAAHLASELFNSMAGTKITRISYKAASQESTDLMAGVVQMAFQNGASVNSLLQTGKLRALAVASAKPSMFYPDLPTIAATLPGFEFEAFVASFAPAGTPDAIVRRLSQEIAKALAIADVKDRLVKLGLEPVGSTPEQLGDIIKSEVARLTPIVKAIKATGNSQ